MSLRRVEVLQRFANDLHRQYGDRLMGVYRFTEHTPIDEEEEIDLDVAVILADGAWSFREEKKKLARLTFDVLMETELYIRTWPVPLSAWLDPATSENPVLIRDMKEHAEPILEPA